MITPTLYQRLERQLRRLHELSLAGQEESEEAVELRNKMSKSWERLSAEQEEQLNTLSEQLYAFQGILV